MSLNTKIILFSITPIIQPQYIKCIFKIKKKSKLNSKSKENRRKRKKITKGTSNKNIKKISLNSSMKIKIKIFNGSNLIILLIKINKFIRDLPRKYFKK